MFSLLTPDAKILIENEIPQNKKQWLDRLESAIASELTEKEIADTEGELQKDVKEQYFHPLFQKGEDRWSRRFAFKWTLPNNQVSIYQGQWRDALPHGNGKYKYATKASYEGVFVKGKRHGQVAF